MFILSLHSIPEGHFINRSGMPMQFFTLLYANAIDTTPLMRSGLNNGAQGDTFHWAAYYTVEQQICYYTYGKKQIYSIPVYVFR